MSVTEVVARKDYTGNGSVDAFAYTWRITDKTHLEVLVDGVVQTVDTDYTVSGVDAAAGGSVTFTTAPADQTVVTILRKQPLSQLSDYVLNEAHPSDRLEKDLDKVVMALQQDRETLTRALRAPKADALDMVLPAVASRASRVLGFTSTGLPTAVDLDAAGGDVSLGTAIVAGASAARTLAERFAHPVNVKDEGAVGDGVADDTAAIQAAITRAKALGVTGILGGVVYFPPGQYLISAPLVLPRTGTSPTNIVHLVGADVRSVRLKGADAFPTNRAMIEWEASATQTWHQRVARLTLWLPSVAGTMAIHYAPTDQSTQAAMLAESLQLDLDDVLIEGDNTYHTRLIYLQGNIKNSRLRRVVGDAIRGSETFDTIVLETETTYPNDDGSGLVYSEIHGLYAGQRLGGWLQAFKGRMHRTVWDTCFANGTRSAPSYEFINSTAMTLRNLANEGGGSQPQMKFTTCTTFDLTNCGVGSPQDNGAGVGNGIEFLDCQDVVWRGHTFRAGNPTFAASSVKHITIDADCRRLRFEQFLLAGPVSTEITNSAPAGEVEGEFYDVNVGARYFLGSPKAGVLQGWVTSGSQNVALGTLPAFTYVSNVRVQVTEGFDSDGTDLLTVGYDANADAYVEPLDVTTPGILTPTLGAEVGYVGAARAVEAYYTNGGTEPTTGKALVILEYRPVDSEPA